MQVKGATIYDIGIKEKGLNLMRKAVRINPSRQNIMVFVTRLENHQEYSEEVIGLYDLLLERDKSDIFAIVGRGYGLLDQNRLSEAEMCARQAISLDPDNAQAHYLLGNILLESQDYSGSIAEFKKSIPLGYWSPECALGGCAYCWLKLGEFGKASEIAKKALAINPNYEFGIKTLKEAEKRI